MCRASRRGSQLFQVDLRKGDDPARYAEKPYSRKIGLDELDERCLEFKYRKENVVVAPCHFGRCHARSPSQELFEEVAAPALFFDLGVYFA